MRAIVIEEFGGPEVLHVRDAPSPEPERGQVRVRVEAVSVNLGIDGRLRAGKSQFRVKLPITPGIDPVGTIDAIGDDVDAEFLGARAVVTSFVAACGACDSCLRGDSVRCPAPIKIGIDHPGGYAEYVVLPATAVTLVPDGLDPVTACVIARHFPTAMAMLRRVRLSASDRVLITGATGGLGSALVQLAAEAGATVIAAAGSRKRLEAAMDLGAALGVDYGTESLSERVRALTDGAGVEVALENVGTPDLFPEVIEALGVGGRLWTVGAHGGGTVPLDLRRLYMRSLSVNGGLGPIAPDDMRSALVGASAGRYRALIDIVLPLDSAPEAHRRAEERDRVGKVVLAPQLGPA